MQRAQLVDVRSVDEALDEAAHVLGDRQRVDAIGENDAGDGGVVQFELGAACLGVEAGLALQFGGGRDLQLELDLGNRYQTNNAFGDFWLFSTSAKIPPQARRAKKKMVIVVFMLIPR